MVPVLVRMTFLSLRDVLKIRNKGQKVSLDGRKNKEVEDSLMTNKGVKGINIVHPTPIARYEDDR